MAQIISVAAAPLRFTRPARGVLRITLGDAIVAFADKLRQERADKGGR